MILAAFSFLACTFGTLAPFRPMYARSARWERDNTGPKMEFSMCLAS